MMTNANESVMDGDIAWGGMAQTAHETLADSGREALAQQGAIGEIVDLLGKLRKEIDDNLERLASLRGSTEQPQEAEATPDASANQDAADAVVTSSSSEDLTLEDACIIGGGALAVGGLAYLAYRALFR
jgi:hypothetical protein